MYRCKNKPAIGDCIIVKVDVLVQEMKVHAGTAALVLGINHNWDGGTGSPLLTVKFPNDEIHNIPSSWCELCQRK